MRVQSVNSIFVVKSCQEPRTPSSYNMDTHRRPVGRSQATTDAQDRVRCFHQSLGFRHVVTQDA